MDQVGKYININTYIDRNHVIYNSRVPRLKKKGIKNI